MIKMNEEKITISVNEEDVQNIINCYEEDIKKLEQLQNNWNELKKYTATEIEKAQHNYESRDINRFELAVRKNVLLKLQLKMKGLEGNNAKN